MLLVDKGLLTKERALALVADVASRFGQEIDPAEELRKADEELKKRQAERDEGDAFSTPPAGPKATGAQPLGGKNLEASAWDAGA